MSLTEKIAKLPDNSLQFLHDGYFFQERAQPCGDRRRLETGGLENSWTVMPTRPDSGVRVSVKA